MQGFAKGFGTPDSTTTFPNGFEDVLEMQGAAVGRLTLRPGWRWSNDLQPLKATDSCLARHVGYCLSGALHVEMDDGTTLEVGCGELYVIPPGHDAWVVGSETCTMLDWGKTPQPAATIAEEIGAAR